MPLQTSTIRPGLLVSLKTTLQGNVSYRTETLESENITADGAQRARWETERTVTDPKEHERATEKRSKIRHTVTRICANTAFGLLCPEDRAAELEAAVTEARAAAEAFNATASYSRISVYVITGRVAADDKEAVRAINSEVTNMLAEMERGVRNLDASAIRDAANRARSLGSMLTPAAAARVADAIEAARAAAKRIVKAGETAAVEVDRYALNKIANARTDFLDMDEAAEVAAPAAEARAVDLEPETEFEEGARWDRAAQEAEARGLDMDEAYPLPGYEKPNEAGAAASLFPNLEF